MLNPIKVVDIELSRPLNTLGRVRKVGRAA